jgi:CBS domain-containing protein
MDHFVLSEHDELPVVESNGELCGVISRRDVLRIYSAELLKRDFLGVSDATEAAGSPGGSVVLEPGHTTAQVPIPQRLIGRSLREANLRSADRLTVIGVRPRGERFEHLPDPDRKLVKGDTLIVVGDPQDIARFRA